MESECQTEANIICDRIFQDVYGRRPKLEEDKGVLLLMSLVFMEARIEQLKPNDIEVRVMNLEVHQFAKGAAWMYRRLKGADLTERETEAARKAALNGKS
jgi:hypothetical protein